MSDAIFGRNVFSENPASLGLAVRKVVIYSDDFLSKIHDFQVSSLEQ